MALRRKNSDDYIGPSTGIMKWVNKFFRFVLFPFIHPLLFVIVLVTFGGSVVGIHHFANVPYSNVGIWVVDKVTNMYDKIADKYDVNFDTKKVSEIGEVNELVSKTTKPTETKKTYKIVRAIDRKAFKKAQEIPVDVKATLEGQSTSDAVDNNDLFRYRKDFNLGLTYSKEPRIVKGEISVVNVNEIRIDGELMFLYGIYADPTSDNGIDGALYLQELVKEKEAECRVVAFTQNAELTAVCVVDGISINQKMVDMGISKNVSLY